MPSPAVFVGVDIGKSGHFAVAVDATGATIRQTAVANDETAVRSLIAWAKERRRELPGCAIAMSLLAMFWPYIAAGVLLGVTIVVVVILLLIVASIVS